MSYKFGGFNFVESGYLDARPFLLPPFEFTFETIFIDPQDPNDPVINASNPTSGANAATGTGTSTGNNDPYNIESLRIEGVGFDSYPPGIPSGYPVQNISFTASVCFWEAGTLWLIISGQAISGDAHPWYLRGALYKLSPTGTFEYVETDLKEYSTSHWTQTHQIKILKTPTGTSLFTRANDTPSFGNGRGLSGGNGLLRFEISNTGVPSTYFYRNDDIKPSSWSASQFIMTGVSRIIDNRLEINLQSSNTSDKAIATWGVYDGLEFVYTNANDVVFGDYRFTYTRDTVNTEISIFYDGNLLETYPVQNNFTTNSFPSFSGVLYNNNDSFLLRLRKGRSTEFGGDSTVYAFYLFGQFNQPPVKITNFILPSTLDRPTYNIANGNVSNRVLADEKGNMLFLNSNPVGIYYYRTGSTYGIDITSQFGLSTQQYNRTNEAITPYGFATFVSGGRVFPDTGLNALYFIQPSN